MLASIFVSGGVDALRDPKPKVPAAEPVARQIASALPVDLPDDTEQLIKINAGVQVGAGLLLALGKFPRLSSLALAGSLVPTTFAAHRFWEVEDDSTRSQQMVQFTKNVSLLGGLLMAALDTEGRPSVGYRASRASKRARRRADATAAKAQARAERARASAAKAAAKGSGRAVKGQAKLTKEATRGARALVSALPG